jgi:H3 lysine-79-specific histone-lysine N-methyltransferase
MLSFFGSGSGNGDKPSSSSGPIISTVTVKKPTPRPRLTGPTPRSGPLITKPSSSSSVSRPASTSASQSKSDNHLKADNRLLHKNSKSRLGSSPSSSASRSPASKRKTPTPSRIQSESSSDSETREPKRKRPHAGNGTPQRLASSTATPLPGEEEVRRKVFCLDEVDERGEFGRAWTGFVGCEEVVRGVRRGWATGNDPGRGELEKYVPCKYSQVDQGDPGLMKRDFPQAGFGKGDILPSVELLYPAKGCREQ